MRMLGRQVKRNEGIAKDGIDLGCKRLKHRSSPETNERDRIGRAQAPAGLDQRRRLGKTWIDVIRSSYYFSDRISSAHATRSVETRAEGQESESLNPAVKKGQAHE
ncbi:hypothetical protein [Nitrobacter sp.]|uniref:hypothetical protein n=1 Tax=Nitrobacter sp. TaxID=29420 RepID=UPI00399D770B